MTASDSSDLFYRLVWPHRAFVLRSARLVAGPNDSDDLAQETLMRAFAALPNFTPDAQGRGMKAWLLRILRNIHTDRLRAVAARLTPQSLSGSVSEELTARVDSSAVAADVGDVDSLLQSFSDQTVIDALLALPVDIRWTLLLVDVEGLEHSQVAEILEIPVGTVKSRVSRGRVMLRQRLVAPIVQSGGPR